MSKQESKHKNNHKNKRDASGRKWLIAVVILAIAAIAVFFYPVSESPGSDYVDGPPAHVESVEILIMESFPVQVSAVAKGYLPNPCTRIGRIDVGRTIYGDFDITINTQVASDADACIQVIQPFEETVPLNVTGHYAGLYTVSFNNPDGTTTSATFELQMDNFVKEYESCSSSSECSVPMRYAVQSNCPYQGACINEECRVVCPISYHDPDPNVSVSYPYPCNASTADTDCDCSERGSRTIECLCADGGCVSVEY
jgi:hypothetical protein